MSIPAFKNIFSSVLRLILLWGFKDRFYDYFNVVHFGIDNKQVFQVTFFSAYSKYDEKIYPILSRQSNNCLPLSYVVMVYFCAHVQLRAGSNARKFRNQNIGKQNDRLISH